MVIRPIAAIMVTLMAGAGSARAHAFLEHAAPPVGGSVATSPPTLDLYFTEGVVPHFSTVEVLDPSGRKMRVGPLRAAGNGRELVVPVPHLAPGRYTVVWHVTSQDTHKTEGRFSFTVAH